MAPPKKVQNGPSQALISQSILFLHFFTLNSKFNCLKIQQIWSFLVVPSMKLEAHPCTWALHLAKYFENWFDHAPQYWFIRWYAVSWTRLRHWFYYLRLTLLISLTWIGERRQGIEWYFWRTYQASIPEFNWYYMLYSMA